MSLGIESLFDGVLEIRGFGLERADPCKLPIRNRTKLLLVRRAVEPRAGTQNWAIKQARGS
jgi:hypothetical protein